MAKSLAGGARGSRIIVLQTAPKGGGGGTRVLPTSADRVGSSRTQLLPGACFVTETATHTRGAHMHHEHRVRSSRKIIC